MRPIDADELLKKQQHFVNAIAGEMAIVFAEDIDNAPTIDPDTLRPKGRWHLNENGKWACSECEGLAVEHPDEPDKWQALTDCCPNCGAKMEV